MTMSIMGALIILDTQRNHTPTLTVSLGNVLLMARGRNRELSEVRFLVELYLHQRNQVQTSAIGEQVGVSKQTVRNRAKELESAGDIEIIEYGAGYSYALTDQGLKRVRAAIRESI